MVGISTKFIKSSLLYTISGALPMASAVLLLPFYMANLTTAQFGALSIYLALSLLVQLLVVYSYDTSLYVHYHEYKHDKRKLSVFVSSAFVLMLLIGMASFILFSTLGYFFFDVFFNGMGNSFFPNGLLAISGGILQALFKVYSNLLQSREKQETYFWSSLLLFSAIVVFTIAGLSYFPHSLFGPLGGRAMALAVAAAWVLARVVKEFGIHFSVRALGESFSFNVYSFIYQLQQWVINYFDRLIMLLYIPLSDVGVYDFAIKCLIGIELLMNGLHSSFLPKVVKILMPQESKGTTQEINRYYNGFIAVVMLVVATSIFVLPPAIEWISNYLQKPDYKDSMEWIPYLAVVYLVRSVRLFFGLPYSVLKYTKPLPPIYLLVALLKIGGVFLFASWLGLMGVIISSYISLLVETALLYLNSRHRFAFSFNFNKILIAPFSLFALVIAVELFMPTSFWLLHAGYCLVCGAVLLFVYRSDLKSIKVFSN
jgi:O-antigen/teichoic acid export membrane protein